MEQIKLMWKLQNLICLPMKQSRTLTVLSNYKSQSREKGQKTAFVKWPRISEYQDLWRRHWSIVFASDKLEDNFQTVTMLTSKMNRLKLVLNLFLVFAHSESQEVFEALPSDSSKGNQRFLREPLDQIASIGEHVTLPCRVVNKLGALQWTRDDFGLGTDRNLTGYKRYKMTGSDEEGKTLPLLSLWPNRPDQIVDYSNGKRYERFVFRH